MKARDNPFRTARVRAAIRYTHPADEPDDGREGAVPLLPRLQSLGYRAAIVGPHGSGKTTLLEDLERLLAERGFRITHVQLRADERQIPREWRGSTRRLDSADIVCLDGAEQLGSVAWLRFRWQARHAGGLIVTTHRGGRLATLVACTTSARLLDRIVRRLAPEALAAQPTSTELFARHRGNLRDALRELYDVYATAPTDRGSPSVGPTEMSVSSQARTPAENPLADP